MANICDGVTAQYPAAVARPDWQGKGMIGRGIRGRGMRKRQAFEIIPLPLIPLPNHPCLSAFALKNHAITLDTPTPLLLKFPLFQVIRSD